MSAPVIRGTGKPTIWTILTIAVAPFAILVGVQLYWYLTRTTVGEVESMIERNLDIGATTDEVLTFLDERDIDHGGLYATDEYPAYALVEAGYGEGVNVIGAIIRDTSRTFFGTGHIEVFFIFDSDYRLSDYIFQEGATTL
jgi:hypothetical protein